MKIIIVDKSGEILESGNIITRLLLATQDKYKQLFINTDSVLGKDLKHPIWKCHKRNESIYFMDGKKDRWKIVYYPIYQDGKTQEFYNEARALMQNIDKNGFWCKEVPLRYLKT